MSSKISFTPEQEKAISANGGTILVSAAAGSGKTAVLTERVIRYLTGNENADIRKLLVVTFTNLAAAQMKSKISSKITSAINENPEMGYLRIQQLRLPLADICTIDSFCVNLVRENFHALEGVTPDFRILSNDEKAELFHEAAENVFKRHFDSEDEVFATLAGVFDGKKDELEAIVRKLYEDCSAYPFPSERIACLCEVFSDSGDIKDSAYGREILGILRTCLAINSERICRCADLMEINPFLAEKFGAMVSKLENIVSGFIQVIDDGTWEDIAEYYGNIDFPDFKAVRNYNGADRDYLRYVHGSIKDLLHDYIDVFGISREDNIRSTEKLKPIVKCFTDIVLELSDELIALKRSENVLDFNDTLHLAIDLLVDGYDENGKPVKSGLAKELSAGYDEILVDEYQDVNEAQNTLFSVLSDDEKNLFVVGDVKQSIYKFRQAMPEIFLKKRLSLEGKEPGPVTLTSNFRSREGITEFANFLFSRIMSEYCGDLCYDENERLNYGNIDYETGSGADASFVLLGREGRKCQAKYIADYVENAVSSGMTVQDGKSRRPVKFSDFAVLYYSVDNQAKELVEEFEQRNIPYISERKVNYINTPEVVFALSLLKIVDNPVDDIALLTAMMSPVFGFTPDDLAAMRCSDRKCPIYNLVVSSAKEGNAKCIAFIEKLRLMRLESISEDLGDFIRYLLDETGYFAYAMAMKDAVSRRNNLHKLIECAGRYSARSNGGISGFIRYAKRLSELEPESSREGNASGNDAVVITTIHKSKGLEFPVVFLPGLEKSLDNNDKASVLLARECGIGIKDFSDDFTVKSNTLSSIAVKYENKRKDMSEKIRLLYVGVTRAREKLIMISSCKGDGTEEKAKAAAAMLDRDFRIIPESVSFEKSYDTIIMAALMTHPDAGSLRKLTGLEFPAFDILRGRKTGNEIHVNVDVIYPPAEDDSSSGKAPECAEADGEMVRLIAEEAGYRYPYESLSAVLSKRIASKLDGESFNSRFFASETPLFENKKLTAARKGTAVHRFMQMCDMKQAAIDADAEIRRVRDSGALSDREADSIDREKISAFFSSNLYSRMIKSEKLWTELPFTSLVPASETEHSDDPALSGETVVIQGVADAAFIENGSIVIVDYKTDINCTEEELRDRHTPQLVMYRRCLSELLEMPVSQTMIYSFELGREIEIF